ncbi:Cj0814 family flagellar-dependent secreted protein [uncultured Campylobacter sp.]|uniref:Cj0814 family flagellar-dependent secreted protein n=1 Tax=uncultured Campylobacter sp. TaxID=218934 RepID=UPI00261A06A7|nr:hypothetical protein [uncultured Campylobacter sp.]
MNNLSISSLSHNQISQHINEFRKKPQKLSSSNESLNNTVKDKSEAVSEILGYGVDSEGFFTSDFNETAAIPKDFKIYAKDLENLLDSFSSSDLKAFSSVDITKSLKNIYNLFTQIAPKNNSTFYTKDDLASFPAAFIYDEKSLNFIKGYDFKEWQGMGDYIAEKGTKLVILNETNTNDIFSYTSLDLSAYTNKDENISKAGVFLLFASKLINSPFVEGETTTLGKINGLDKGISKKDLEEFTSFMNANKLNFNSSTSSYSSGIDIIGLGLNLALSKEHNLSSQKDAAKFLQRYKELLNSNLSLDEFKDEYLNFKKEYESFLQGFSKELKEKELSKIPSSDLNLNDEKENKRSFTPIQAESKSQTFTYDDITKNFFLTFLENERKKGNDVLELLEKLFKVDKSKIDFKV